MDNDRGIAGWRRFVLGEENAHSSRKAGSQDLPTCFDLHNLPPLKNAKTIFVGFRARRRCDS